MPKKNKNSEKSSSKERLAEIISILRKHDISRGISPKKLRLILEDLGPTFIKLGQIMSMRRDMIPAAYCIELTKLRSDVAAMSMDEVNTVIEESCGAPIDKIFASFDETPLGSASIAGAYLAVLKDGSKVVVKVQRKGIHDKMSRDIALLRRAVKILKIVAVHGEIIDFGMVLDELWSVAQEEMNFLVEAKNAEEFYELNKEVVFASCPHIYKSYTTSRVLVMEYIEGFCIDDGEALTEAGYDLNEIGSKIADNYVKQIIDDGFFHADPHHGNIRIRGGQIVWIDMGMMGRLSKRDQKLLGMAVKAVAKHDVATIKDVVMTMGNFRGNGSVNHSKLYTDIDDMLLKYGSMELGNMNLSKVIEDVLGIAKTHGISMPSGVSMLGRGIAAFEGVIADLCPEINVLEITASRVAGNILHNIDIKKEITDSAKKLLESGKKGLEVPSLTADILKMFMKGQGKINMELHSSDEFTKIIYRIVNKIVTGILVASLLMGSSLICTTSMKPEFMGIPLLGAVGYFTALVLSIIMFANIRKNK